MHDAVLIQADIIQAILCVRPGPTRPRAARALFLACSLARVLERHSAPASRWCCLSFAAGTSLPRPFSSSRAARGSRVQRRGDADGSAAGRSRRRNPNYFIDSVAKCQVRAPLCLGARRAMRGSDSAMRGSGTLL